jgi:hypothetical protein
MTLLRNLTGTTPAAASGDTPEGVSFDGSNDYLSRSSDLTGNADSKTFTFSAWVYPEHDGSWAIYSIDTFKFRIYGNASQTLIIGRNSASTNIYYYDTYNALPKQSWSHLIVSVDLTNTSRNHIYINEIDKSTYSTFTNDNIDFTNTSHYIANSQSSGKEFKGRLAHVFLDYTYRDLSIESNRRLFIDADGKPASGQASLNPILYLPLKDAATAGSNSGTGGDFTVNGVLDTAGRAPNQFNCSASVFDGTNDYLSRGSANYGSSQKLTGSVIFRTTSANNSQFILSFDGGDGQIIANPSNGTINVFHKSNPSSGIMLATINAECSINKSYSLQWSYDTSDTGKRHFYLNGVSVTSSTTFSFYQNATTVLDGSWAIGARGGTFSDKFTGSIGELWFEWDVYRDLATDNPFWDSDTNLPKPVRQVISETGTTPLFAMPLRGDDAGNNLGTGGDFTVNSGPFTGARGGSEFWARTASLGPGHLSSTTSISNSTTLTMVFSFKTSYTGGISLFSNKVGSNYHANIGYRQGTGSPGSTMFSFRDSSHNDCVQFSIPDSSLAGIGKWNTIMFSVNSSNSSLYKVYVNGVAPSLSNVVASGASMKFSSATTYFAYYYGVQDPYDIGSFYLDDSYIDFSQESNRNLFVDQLGYLKDLSPAIDAGDIAEPSIYMKFDDTSALGTNSGTGGNFTVNGTVTAGGDVDPNA